MMGPRGPAPGARSPRAGPAPGPRGPALGLTEAIVLLRKSIGILRNVWFHLVNLIISIESHCFAYEVKVFFNENRNFIKQITHFPLKTMVVRRKSIDFFKDICFYLLNLMISIENLCFAYQFQFFQQKIVECLTKRIHCIGKSIFIKKTIHFLRKVVPNVLFFFNPLACEGVKKNRKG